MFLYILILEASNREVKERFQHFAVISTKNWILFVVISTLSLSVRDRGIGFLQHILSSLM
jgi:hypothetical protein